MYYAYILRSLSHPAERYIGSTEDLKSRLARHNKGDVPHTGKFRPWKVEAYFAFETKEKPSPSSCISNPAADTLLPNVISDRFDSSPSTTDRRIRITYLKSEITDYDKVHQGPPSFARRRRAADGKPSAEPETTADSNCRIGSAPGFQLSARHLF